VGRGTGLPDLAEDIAVEGLLTLALTEEIKEVDERTTTSGRERDPHDHHFSPGHRRSQLWRSRRRRPFPLTGRGAGLHLMRYILDFA
jgi:hypothetical protein